MSSSMGGGNRNFANTPTDSSGIALTVCVLLLIYSLLCFLIRIYARRNLNGPLGSDDAYCALATVWKTYTTKS